MGSSPRLTSESPQTKKALFIDADPEVRAMLANILDPLVWSVRHAPDNKTALALAQAAHYDLILTSEKTSAKEDVELLRRIRIVRPHTRVIILTEESTPTEIITAMREHAFSYFSRPFSLSSLADMVHAAADGPCWDDGIEVLSATPDWIRLAASCDMKTAERLIQFMHEIADLPETEADAVGLAFREILMNAIEHGGHFRADQHVVAFLVVDQLINQLLGEQNTIAARAQPFRFAMCNVPSRISLRIGNGSMIDFVQSKSFTGVFHSTHHHVLGSHVGDFDVLVSAKRKGCARAAMVFCSPKSWLMS